MPRENLYEMEIAKGSNETADALGHQPSSRIAYGGWAIEGSVPYIVAIAFDLAFINPNLFDAPHCSGTLIRYNWVLTAAHCLFNGGKWPETYFIFAGSVDLRNGDCAGLRGIQTLQIRRQDYENEGLIFWNKNFPKDPSFQTDADIGLIKFPRHREFSMLPDRHVATINYNSRHSNDVLIKMCSRGMLAKISGWGTTETNEMYLEMSTALRGKLKTGNVRFIADRSMMMTDGTLNPDYHHKDYLLMDQSTGIWPCGGDSGGPAMMIISGQQMLVGIHRGCYPENTLPAGPKGDRKKMNCKNPGNFKCIYTSTFSHRNWIQGVLNSN